MTTGVMRTSMHGWFMEIIIWKGASFCHATLSQKTYKELRALSSQYRLAGVTEPKNA